MTSGRAESLVAPVFAPFSRLAVYPYIRKNQPLIALPPLCKLSGQKCCEARFPEQIHELIRNKGLTREGKVLSCAHFLARTAGKSRLHGDKKGGPSKKAATVSSERKQEAARPLKGRGWGGTAASGRAGVGARILGTHPPGGHGSRRAFPGCGGVGALPDWIGMPARPVGSEADSQGARRSRRHSPACVALRVQ